MNRCYLLLGANLGDTLATFQLACSLIETTIGEINKSSSIYSSPAWGYESKNDYHNQCLEVLTQLNPFELLNRTQKIERELGRTAKTTVNYIDRVIDIDMLDFDGMIINTNTLTVPHPRMEDRLFVLLPLKEIAPNYMHPKTGATITEMVEKTTDKSATKPITLQQK